MLKKKALTGALLLEQSMNYHDPQNLWGSTTLHIHIQEPRISTPDRYSIVKLNNTDSSFVLARNKDNNIVEYIIDSIGNRKVLLNGIIETDSTLITKYRLDASRNKNYRTFYQMLYGLPMSLKNRIAEFKNASETTFDEEACYKIEILLKAPMFSKNWNLFISKTNKNIIGLEITFPNRSNEGERIYFEKNITINTIKIPRIRHWHTLKDNSYSGTDIIIKELKKLNK